MDNSHDKEKRRLIERIMNPNQSSGSDLSGSIYNKYFQRWLKTGIVIAVVLIIAIMAIFYYNRFTTITHRALDARAKIEIAQQQRENLVPALSMATSDFITHENEVFVHTSEARANFFQKRVQSPRSIADQHSLPLPADGFDNILSNLLAIGENYPDLKLSAPYQILMSKMADTESDIYNRRMEYNTIVYEFNVSITTFPSYIFAWIFRVEPKSYFKWSGKPEWVTSLDEKDRLRIINANDKWHTRLSGEE